MIKMLTSRFGNVIRLRKIVGMRDSIHLYDPAEIEKVRKIKNQYNCIIIYYAFLILF